MTRHILVTTDRQSNNISIFQEEPIILVLADRADMLALKKIEQCEQSGIYILLGDNQAYVGQASGSIYNRLTMHDKDKLWWNRLIFFTRTANDFGKHQTDYLEKKLIDLYRTDSNYHLENKNHGNTSYIDIASKMIANNSLDVFFSVLENIANINIFEAPEQEDGEVTDIQETSIYQIRIANGEAITGKSARATYINFVKHLLKNPNFREILIADGEPRSKAEGNRGKYIGTKQKISPKGQKMTREIEPEVHLYVNLSINTTKVAIKKIADTINVPITIDFPK